MHRNTVLFIIILTVIASLLIGINMGKRISGSTTPPTITELPISTPPTIVTSTSPSPEASVAAQLVAYVFTDCGISFSYQNDFTLLESTQGAQLVQKQNPNQQINLACASEIPRPPLAKDRIDTASVAGLTVNLYHDASSKDGSPLDAVIFTHPKNGLDVAVLGFGPVFDKLLQTIKLLP